MQSTLEQWNSCYSVPFSDSDLKHLAGSFVQACYSKINMFSSSIAGPRVHDDVISCYFQILDVIITSGQKRLHNYYCLLLCFFFAFLFFCFYASLFLASLLFYFFCFVVFLFLPLCCSLLKLFDYCLLLCFSTVVFLFCCLTSTLLRSFCFFAFLFLLVSVLSCFSVFFCFVVVVCIFAFLLLCFPLCLFWFL